MSPKLALNVIGILAMMGAGLSPVMAAPAVPSSVSPGQVEKRLQAPEPVPGQLDLRLPAPVEEQSIPDNVRRQLEKNTFTLRNVVIAGDTAYPPEELAFAYQDKIGHTISLLDARQMAIAITDFYHKDGYILSQAVVPTQSLDNGTLTIRVVEGYIGNVSFEGDERSNGEKRVLEAYADKIKNLHPARMKDLERYMLLMNDLPGASVHGLIRPSNTGLGSADLVLTVTHKSFDASYTFDNRGTKYLGPWQQTAIVDANSLFGMYDHTQLRLMTSYPFQEVFNGQIEHDETLNSEGTKLSLLASHTRTQPGDALKVLKVIGYSDLFEAKVTHPFLRLRQQSLVGRVTFDVNNTTSNVFSSTPLSTDRLRTARVGGTYTFLDTLRGNNLIDVQLSQGMNIFSATSSGATRSNVNGNSAFTKTNFDLSRLQTLPANFSILMGATGQYSFSPLLTDEQFALGGSDYGRSFDPSELLGDSGIAGKAELRYGKPVDAFPIKSYQLYSFYDIGKVWVRSAAAGTASHASLSSAGVGTRVNVTNYVTTSLEASVPVTKPTNDQTAYRHSPRIFFSLAVHY